MFSPHFQKLTSCILKLEMPDKDVKTEGKMELMSICRQLIPAGKPNFLEVVKFEPIRDLIPKIGSAKMHKLLILVVQDFCNSINVVRNMNEDQIIETAGMLLEECDNFRMEDYLMMFQMAKKGELVKIMDRIDIQIVTLMMNEYWKRRYRAGESFLEEGIKHLDSLGPTIRRKDQLNYQELAMEEGFKNITTSLSEMKSKFQEFKDKAPKSE